MESITFARYLTTDVPNVFGVRGFVRRRSLQMTEFRHFTENGRCAFGGRDYFGRFVFVVVQMIAIVDRVWFTEYSVVGLAVTIE